MRKPRTVRLEESRERGIRLNAFLNDAFVAEYFDRLRVSLVDGMIAAGPEDDAGRRAAAFSIRTLDTLWNLISQATADGSRAEDAFMQLKRNNDG